MDMQVISVFELGSVALTKVKKSQAAFFEKSGPKTGISIAGAKSNVVISVLLNGEQTEDILFGSNGIVQHMRPGTVVLS